ncbi:unnamed protein product [Acanthosepion pharaonis]|uniref:BTB domain-containing protein n=1 Tax=Acanthosepion pharaonis TaxID=158019 RepID=A0A812B1G4_ACAPH|nr:unnamed protein product [Sepia pharaonis]
MVSGARKKPGTSEVCSNHFVDGCPTIMNPLPTLNIEPPPKDKEDKKKSASRLYKSIIERNLFNKTQEKYREQPQQQQQQQQQEIVKLSETVKSSLQRSSNKVLEQLQCVEESRNEKLFKAMLYQMTPQTQNKPQQKINVSAALGKPANIERSRKSPLNIASTSNSTVESKTIEVENASPPPKKVREIHIDIDVSEEESPVVSKPLLQPTIEPPAQKSVTTSMKSTPAQPSSVVHNPVLDINVPQKQKRILVVPNHQQSVMSNLSSLWKAGRLCDAFISNGTVNVKVHKMILGAVCPKVLDVFYSTPQHKLPKVTFPNSHLPLIPLCGHGQLLPPPFLVSPLCLLLFSGCRLLIQLPWSLFCACHSSVGASSFSTFLGLSSVPVILQWAWAASPPSFVSHLCLSPLPPSKH